MDTSTILTENKKVSSKFLAVVFGYMFIGLAITALTGFLWAFFLAKNYNDGAGALTEEGMGILLVSVVAAAIVSVVDSIVMLIVSARSGKAPWVGYILYALAIGVTFSVFILAPNVTADVLLEAFGLTALAFGIMFLIGYFSPVNLSPLAFVGIALLFGVLIISLFFGVWFLIAGPSATLWWNYIVSLIIVVVAMLFTGFDANQMGRMVEKGITNHNIALYCAFNLYSDFIILFVRILYILMLNKDR